MKIEQGKEGAESGEESAEEEKEVPPSILNRTH